ncbi:MAG TPA: PilZ domain-containing protein [Lacunisphaera sp.]
MLFFKRILDIRKPPAISTERRVATRFAVSRQFPLQTMLNIAGRDEHGQLLKPKGGEGWDWPGRLVDLSVTGARLQVPLTVIVQRDDTGRLRFDLQGHKFEVPCRIAHISDRRDYALFGLELNLTAAGTYSAYRQLLDLVALGSSLKLVKPLARDKSGYLLEQYAGEPASRLSVWRLRADKTIAAFEFQLKDCFVRGLAENDDLECFVGADAAKGRAVKPAQSEEINRLYQWVVLNLASTVPADVRAFLLRHAI